MKYNRQIAKDKKRRKLVAKYRQKRLALKAISQNLQLPTEVSYSAQLKLSKLPRNSSLTRIKNRCVITGRPKAVFRDFKVSRIMLRELAAMGRFPGVFKSVW